MSRFVKSGIVSAFLILLWFLPAFFLQSCSKPPKPPEILSVGILNAANEIRSDIYKEALKEFAAGIPGLIAGATEETVAPDIAEADLSRRLTGCDVAIFPTILNKKIRTYSDAFYPLSASDTVILPIFKQTYAAVAPASVWALPLVLDPVVMVYNQAVYDQLNRPAFPGDWAEMYYICELLKSDRKISPPYLFFLSKNPLALEDSIVSLQLSFGYDNYAIQSITPSRELPPEEVTAQVGRAVKNLKLLLSPKPAEALTEIPHTPDLSTFIETKGLVTFARYSEFLSLPAEKRSQLRAKPIFSAGKPTTVCYGIAAAVPRDSTNPGRAKEWIHYLISKGNEIAEKQQGIPAGRLPNSEAKHPLFSIEDFFVPRETLDNITPKAVLDLLNGNLSLEEFSEPWRSGFFMPSSGN